MPAIIVEPGYLDIVDDDVVCWTPAKLHRWCEDCGTAFEVSALAGLTGADGRCPWCGSDETKSMEARR